MGLGVALGTHPCEPIEVPSLLDLADLEQRNAHLLVGVGEAGDADDLSLMGLQLALLLVGGIGDFRLRESGLQRPDHAAHLVDLGDVAPRGLLGRGS